MIFRNNIRLKKTISAYDWSDGGIGFTGNDPFSGVGTGTGPGSPGTTTSGGQSAADSAVDRSALEAALKSIFSFFTQNPVGLVTAQVGFTKDIEKAKAELSKTYGKNIASNMVDHALAMAKGSTEMGEAPGDAINRILDQLAPTKNWNALEGWVMTQAEAKANGYTNAIDSRGLNPSDRGFNYNEETYRGGKDPIPHISTLTDKNGKNRSDTGFDLASAIQGYDFVRTGSKGYIVPSQYVLKPGRPLQATPTGHSSATSVDSLKSFYNTDNTSETGGGMPSFQDRIDNYDTTAVEQAIAAISDVDTDIQYNHTLAELSGIGLDDQEREYYEAQKQLAINRALDQIENTFEPEGESIIAQQVYNLGENALGGTIGREFVNRWQERYDKAQTTALNEIESTYLAAQQSAIDRNKATQMEMWGKEYDADVKQAELDLDKAKSNALIQFDWDSKNLDRYVTMRGQDMNVEQAELDRILKDKMGEQEYSAYKSGNKWTLFGSLGSAAVKSDWFGDAIGSLWN